MPPGGMPPAINRYSKYERFILSSRFVATAE
jgi:hypothetical protein